MGKRERGASSNLEQGGVLRVRPESRLREMETLVKHNGWTITKVVSHNQKQHHHHAPSCKQKQTGAAPACSRMCSVRRTAGGL